MINYSYTDKLALYSPRVNARLYSNADLITRLSRYEAESAYLARLY